MISHFKNDLQLNFYDHYGKKKFDVYKKFYKEINDFSNGKSFKNEEREES